MVAHDYVELCEPTSDVMDNLLVLLRSDNTNNLINSFIDIYFIFMVGILVNSIDSRQFILQIVVVRSSLYILNVTYKEFVAITLFSRVSLEVTINSVITEKLYYI